MLAQLKCIPAITIGIGVTFTNISLLGCYAVSLGSYRSFERS